MLIERPTGKELAEDEVVADRSGREMNPRERRVGVHHPFQEAEASYRRIPLLNPT